MGIRGRVSVLPFHTGSGSASKRDFRGGVCLQILRERFPVTRFFLGGRTISVILGWPGRLMDSVGIVSAAVTMKSFMGDRVWHVFISISHPHASARDGKPLRIETRRTRRRNEPSRLRNVWAQSLRPLLRRRGVSRVSRLSVSDMGPRVGRSRTRVSGTGRVGRDRGYHMLNEAAMAGVR